MLKDADKGAVLFIFFGMEPIYWKFLKIFTASVGTYITLEKRRKKRGPLKASWHY